MVCHHPACYDSVMLACRSGHITVARAQDGQTTWLVMQSCETVAKQFFVCLFLSFVAIFALLVWHPNTLCTGCLCFLLQLNCCIHCHCRASEARRSIFTDHSLKCNCLIWLCKNQPYQRAVVKVGDNVQLLLLWHSSFIQTCSLCSGCLI